MSTFFRRYTVVGELESIKRTLSNNPSTGFEPIIGQLQALLSNPTARVAMKFAFAPREGLELGSNLLKDCMNLLSKLGVTSSEFDSLQRCFTAFEQERMAASKERPVAMDSLEPSSSARAGNTFWPQAQRFENAVVAAALSVPAIPAGKRHPNELLRDLPTLNGPTR
jgi:hypothetical protein